MRLHRPQRLKLHCPRCGKTSTFTFIDGRYVCVGDEKKQRMGCGKELDVQDESQGYSDPQTFVKG